MNRTSSLALGIVGILLATPVWAQSPPAYLGSWGTTGSGPGQFQFPNMVTVDAAGNVLAADPGRVQVFTSSGAWVNQWPVQAPAPGASPAAIAADGIARIHLVASQSGNEAYDVYTSAGTLASSTFLAGSGCECTLHFDGVAATPGGDSFMTRWGSFHPIGVPSTTVAGIIHSLYPGGSVQWGVPGTGPGQLSKPSGVAVDAAGFVYVADNGTSRIEKFTSDGTFISQWGSAGSGDGQFSSVWGIAVGPNGHVYATDIGLARIQEFTSDGSFVCRWGTSGGGPGQFFFPYSIAIDASGNIFVGDAGNFRIQRFGPAVTPAIPSSWGRLKTLYR